MWFEDLYEDDPMEEAFHFADYERRLKRERQFDDIEFQNCGKFFNSRDAEGSDKNTIKLKFIVSSSGYVSTIFKIV